MHKLLRVVLLGLGFVIAYAHAEDFSVTFDSQVFQKRFEATQPNGDKVIEFVRDGETMQNWTKLIGYRYQQLPRLENDAKKAALAMMQVVKTSNPSAQVQTMAKDNEAIIDFVTWSPEAKSMEFNIFKYAKSRDGNAVVSFQWAYRFSPSSISPYEFGRFRGEWLEMVTSFDLGLVQAAFETK